MATETGVWDLQEVRDKQLASEWSYDAPVDPGGIYGWGNNSYGKLGQNEFDALGGDQRTIHDLNEPHGRRVSLDLNV